MTALLVWLLLPVGVLPNATLTPGARDSRVTATNVQQTICVRGWAGRTRNVSVATKRKVFKLYRLSWSTHARYEVDHLISLELGGSNDIANLWPQPYWLKLGAHQKDKVENYLHHEVCAGRMTLGEAQREITTDWVQVYQALGRK